MGETAASLIAVGGAIGTKAKVVGNTGGVLAVGIIKPGDHTVKCHGIADRIIFVGGSGNNTAGINKTFHCNVWDITFCSFSSLWSDTCLYSGDNAVNCGTCEMDFAKAAY